MTEFCFFSEDEIQKTSDKKFGGKSIFYIAAKQAFYELEARIRTHQSFRQSENHSARDAYCAMNLKEFDGINARQNWSNWRVIPRNLSGRLPAKPLYAVDLCCGIGQSTQVLANYLPEGSKILGVEFNRKFVDLAKRGSYSSKKGSLVDARFSCQSVLENIHDADGKLIEDNTFDLANSCGAIGHHFDPQTTALLVREVARVLKPGGLALLDSGPYGTSPRELTELLGELGFEALHATRSCFADLYTQICFQKKA